MEYRLLVVLSAEADKRIPTGSYVNALCKRRQLVTHSHLFMYFGRTNLNKINFPLPPANHNIPNTDFQPSKLLPFANETDVDKNNTTLDGLGMFLGSWSSSAAWTVVYLVAGTFNSIKTNETLCQSWIFMSDIAPCPGRTWFPLLSANFRVTT